VMLDEAQRQAISELIDAVEAGTLGEVQVVVDEDPQLDLDRAALDQWRELDLDDVGVLVLVATGARAVRFVAGPRLLAEAPEALWQEAAQAVAEGFRSGDPVAGLRRALEPVAALLRRVAPSELIPPTGP
jgi:uncharacterized membrane protein YgcG